MSKNLNNSIQLIVQDELNKLPKPQKVTITKVYTDNKHLDCKTDNGDILTYIPCIANNPTVNSIGVLLFLENDFKMVITK